MATKTAAQIARWQSVALDPAAWRAVPEANLHVTLAFLGDVPASAIGAIGEAMERSLPAAGTRAELDPTPVGIPRRRPRVLAFPLRSHPLEQLADRLREGLAVAGIGKPDDRPFWPHLTVARARRGPGRPGRPAQGLVPLPADLVRGPVEFSEMLLMRSVTAPAGAQYARELTFSLETNGD